MAAGGDTGVLVVVGEAADVDGVTLCVSAAGVEGVALQAVTTTAPQARAAPASRCRAGTGGNLIACPSVGGFVSLLTSMTPLTPPRLDSAELGEAVQQRHRVRRHRDLQREAVGRDLDGKAEERAARLLPLGQRHHGGELAGV